MGYNNVTSLKTSLRGWFDYELPLYNENNEEVDENNADAYFSKKTRPDQMEPEA